MFAFIQRKIQAHFQIFFVNSFHRNTVLFSAIHLRIVIIFRSVTRFHCLPINSTIDFPQCITAYMGIRRKKCSIQGVPVHVTISSELCKSSLFCEQTKGKLSKYSLAPLGDFSKPCFRHLTDHFSLGTIQSQKCGVFQQWSTFCNGFHAWIVLLGNDKKENPILMRSRVPLFSRVFD